MALPCYVRVLLYSIMMGVIIYGNGGCVVMCIVCYECAYIGLYIVSVYRVLI